MLRGKTLILKFWFDTLKNYPLKETISSNPNFKTKPIRITDSDNMKILPH